MNDAEFIEDTKGKLDAGVFDPPEKEIIEKLLFLLPPVCSECKGHKGWIACPNCAAQICWMDIDPKQEGFFCCRRCQTPAIKFIKIPCPKCGTKEACSAGKAEIEELVKTLRGHALLIKPYLQFNYERAGLPPEAPSDFWKEIDQALTYLTALSKQVEGLNDELTKLKLAKPKELMADYWEHRWRETQK